MSKAIKSGVNPIAKAVLYAVMILFALLTIYPIYWVIISSFKTTQQFQLNRIGMPDPWVFINYPQAWELGNFSTLFANSIIYTSLPTLAIIAGSLSAGFAFAKIPSRWTPWLYSSFILGILLTIQSIMVPLFLMVSSIGLYNTRLGVLL